MPINTGLVVGFIVCLVIAVLAVGIGGFLFLRRRTLWRQTPRAKRVPFDTRAPVDKVTTSRYWHHRSNTETTTTGWDSLLSITSQSPLPIAQPLISSNRNTPSLSKQSSVYSMVEDLDLDFCDAQPTSATSLVDSYYSSPRNSPPMLPRLIISESSGTQTPNPNQTYGAPVPPPMKPASGSSSKPHLGAFVPTLEPIPGTPASIVSASSQSTGITTLSGLENFPLPPVLSSLDNLAQFRVPPPLGPTMVPRDLSMAPQIPSDCPAQALQTIITPKISAVRVESDSDLGDHSVALTDRRVHSIEVIHDAGTGSKSGSQVVLMQTSASKSTGLESTAEHGLSSLPTLHPPEFTNPWSSGEALSSRGRQADRSNKQHLRSPSLRPAPLAPLPPPPPLAAASAGCSLRSPYHPRSHSASQSSIKRTIQAATIPEPNPDRSLHRSSSLSELPYLSSGSPPKPLRLEAPSSPSPRSQDPRRRGIYPAPYDLEPFSPPPSASHRSGSSSGSLNIPMNVDSDGGLVFESLVARPDRVAILAAGALNRL